MKLNEALFNWLQIRLVAEARPEDNAARETESFFAEILRDDHNLQDVRIAVTDDTTLHVRYEHEGETKAQRFDKEHAEQLLRDIAANPKYN
ncbi:hypothetical protein ACFFNY_02895 [Paenibacillus hodogayensis]|uniref:Uncharacterized protein n=1 Tax=Paenibacillus hodogayensis TaxID=279208 RepID=A0ABV5VQF6_9BACL